MISSGNQTKMNLRTRYGLVRGLCLLTIMINAPGIARAGTEAGASLKSKYVWAGVLMAEGAVVQGSLKYIADNGLIIGGAFSTVDVGGSGNNQVDILAGYSDSVGELDYETGLVRHSFIGDGPTDNDANVSRAYFSGSLGAAHFVLKSPLKDASWTSAGDVYASAGMVQALPAGFRVAARAGGYYFADDAVFDNGTVAITKTQSFAFRDATLSIEHAAAGMPLELGLHFTLGGERRDGSDLDDHIWFSLHTYLP